MERSCLLIIFSSQYVFHGRHRFHSYAACFFFLLVRSRRKHPFLLTIAFFLSVSIFPQNSGKTLPFRHHFGFLARIWRNHSRAENPKRCLNERISARGTIKSICALPATRHAISALTPLIQPYISISVMPPLHSHAAMIAMSRRCDYIVVAVRWLCHHAAIELPWQCDYVVIIAQRNCNDSMTA